MATMKFFMLGGFVAYKGFSRPFPKSCFRRYDQVLLIKNEDFSSFISDHLSHVEKEQMLKFRGVLSFMTGEYDKGYKYVENECAKSISKYLYGGGENCLNKYQLSNDSALTYIHTYCFNNGLGFKELALVDRRKVISIFRRRIQKIFFYNDFEINFVLQDVCKVIGSSFDFFLLFESGSILHFTGGNVWERMKDEYLSGLSNDRLFNCNYYELREHTY